MGENGEMMQVEDNVLSFQSKAIQFGASNRTVLIRRLHNKPPYMIHRSYYISTEEQKSNKVKNPFKKTLNGSSVVRWSASRREVAGLNPGPGDFL